MPVNNLQRSLWHLLESCHEYRSFPKCRWNRFALHKCHTGWSVQEMRHLVLFLNGQVQRNAAVQHFKSDDITVVPDFCQKCFIIQSVISWCRYFFDGVDTYRQNLWCRNTHCCRKKSCLPNFLWYYRFQILHQTMENRQEDLSVHWTQKNVL